jgi:ABC-type nitrate/sulfonate/bicarbonate transport system substrate-binding protein
MAPASWRAGLSSTPDLLPHPPICRVATYRDAIAPGNSPHEIKLCWSTNAICHVGVAVADELGYFGRHNLKVETICWN